ncbi:hypothetical protein [Mucilaginibacter sp. PAMB04168]|uniref:hypothetical protein n=1 Tax=Mucilaginibacter sp. PAMB04168 TaxID=3138567 RepID=UPI0031F65FED
MQQQPEIKKFQFNNVVTFPYYINYVMGFFIGLPLLFLYGEYGMRYLGIWGLILIFLIVGLTVMGITKASSKNLLLYFDKEALYIVENHKPPQKIMKDSIDGVYSYDYNRIEKSFISLQIKFKTGKNISITDMDTSEKVDQQKALLMSDFLTTLKKEMGFEFIKKNTGRSLQKLGACWYSRPQ